MCVCVCVCVCNTFENLSCIVIKYCILYISQKAGPLYTGLSWSRLSPNWCVYSLAWWQQQEIFTTAHMTHNLCLSHTPSHSTYTHTHWKANQNNNKKQQQQNPSKSGVYRSIYNLRTWLSQHAYMVMFSVSARLPHPIKIVIAGNHELTFERENYDYGIHRKLMSKQLGLSLKATDAEVAVACKDLLQHILYLEDEAVNICGIKVYGSPWWVTIC